MKKFTQTPKTEKTPEVKAIEGISWQLKVLNETMLRIAEQLEDKKD